MSALFSPFFLKTARLRNRIVVTPMCQYQSEDGYVNEWHQAHYRTLARGGAGLVIVEATAVVPEGRITPGDTGIWLDEHVPGLRDIADGIVKTGAVAGIQLSHAGRKAGCSSPWKGGAPLDASDPQKWMPVGPSDVPYIEGSGHNPKALSRDEIKQIIAAFADGARRAAEAGFSWLELHFAHGFLAQNFLSPQANTRDDEYGGSLENRARFMLEVIAAVRTVWPEDFPLTARFGAIEFDGHDEQNVEEAITVTGWLRDAGLDLIDVGLALSTPAANVPWGPNLLVTVAERIRKETSMPVATSWQISDARQADTFILDGTLDLIFMGRTLLSNPNWPWLAAKELGEDKPAWILPAPYAFWLENWPG
ncbi:TPA: NADH:flavin oxidoreductase/NADH oxidase [Kluyvera ascorbata]|uniref:NADH:flavin oxidoreductase/NADH oxidase n=1 Tax=Enterobacteriaceae TaxID=543 RepID=UPI00165EB3A9|nr:MULTISPECIES: NADH:flavin oxidoreductase/NADH oxidase [Enterobacteriaceae]MCB3711910.1 NADH:flavin oxidoreductase/NADH oxidase [Klebsiella pneumoniae]MEB8610310.1 NADH:flavin oxidoreductase/NADH oxidase [Cronobacter sakazakii]WNU05729.1 NADH:flavin oxidoreductase/NADH oxidase [Citrobacter freundii]HAT7516937.1 NADH:flavin oxidoreductase/NADH oxidase [Kluyvera ascorbata]